MKTLFIMVFGLTLLFSCATTEEERYNQLWGISKEQSERIKAVDEEVRLERENKQKLYEELISITVTQGMPNDIINFVKNNSDSTYYWDVSLKMNKYVNSELVIKELTIDDLPHFSAYIPGFSISYPKSSLNQSSTKFTIKVNGFSDNYYRYTYKETLFFGFSTVNKFLIIDNSNGVVLANDTLEWATVIGEKGSKKWIINKWIEK